MTHPVSYRNRKLDRVYEYDERSLMFYHTRQLLLDPPRSISWSIDVTLDQGSEGACVGFGFGHDLNATPQVVSCDDNCAFGIYNAAKLVDEWSGEDYEGTSVLAGAKVLTSRGYYSEYRWAETEYDMAQAMQLGPVIIGIDWYNDMFDPDANGYLHPTGGVAGGHCIAVIALDVEKGYYTVHNSWGDGWGDHGNAKISRADMAFLLSHWGDACVPIRVPSNVDPTPVDPPAPVPPEPTPPAPCNWWCKFWNWITCKVFGQGC